MRQYVFSSRLSRYTAVTAGAFFAFLAILAVSFEAPVAAAVVGAVAFWVIGHGG